MLPIPLLGKLKLTKETLYSLSQVYFSVTLCSVVLIPKAFIFHNFNLLTTARHNFNKQHAHPTHNNASHFHSGGTHSQFVPRPLCTRLGNFRYTRIPADGLLKSVRPAVYTRTTREYIYIYT